MARQSRTANEIRIECDNGVYFDEHKSVSVKETPHPPTIPPRHCGDVAWLQSRSLAHASLEYRECV